MKVDYKIVQKRRDDIMTLVQKLGEVSVKLLAQEFNASEVTIRRDLQYWDDQGYIVRIHGGAKIRQQKGTHENINFTNDRYKHAIAKYAAQFIEDGDTIFVNTSTTALLVIQYIINKRVTVITNNAKAVTTKHDPLVSILLTGGELRFPKESMVGEFASNTLNRVIANKCFIGCSGIHPSAALTTAIQSEAPINEMMITRTKGQVFVLADHTKIGAQYSFISGNIDCIDYLVTDINATKEILDNLQEAGVKHVATLEPLSLNTSENS